ncbi:MAG: matrixin family metalloprotease, partial [Acidobacteriota bacterium]
NIALSNSLTQPNSNIKADSDILGAVRRSLQTWQNAADVDLVLESSDRQSISPPGAAGDGVSLITAAQSPENVLLFSKNPQAASAKTRIFFDRRGFITEADIVLNPFQQFSTDGSYGTFDLESTLTHEIGHLLGLRHSPVMGSTMFENVMKNGTFGFVDLSSRNLSASDVASIRELYGGGEKDDCCAVIAGKLNLTTARSQRNLRVWAEDSVTGRVSAQVDGESDGSFHLGGLPESTYSIFWETNDERSGPSYGELGTVHVSKGETRNLSGNAVTRPSSIGLNYAGINGQLADTAVPVNAGRENVIFLGGKNLDPKSLQIEFSSPFLRALPASQISQDYGDSVSVMSFVVAVDKDTPSGEYSIFVKAADGSRASMIGALVVR